jgi:hypothetical protein
MTAFDLIDSIFARHQDGVPGNERRVTSAQLGYLRNLIDADPEGGALRRDGPNVWLWAPAGRNKYRIEEDMVKGRHKIARLSTLTPSATGRLF